MRIQKGIHIKHPDFKTFASTQGAQTHWEERQSDVTNSESQNPSLNLEISDACRQDKSFYLDATLNQNYY